MCFDQSCISGDSVVFWTRYLASWHPPPVLLNIEVGVHQTETAGKSAGGFHQRWVMKQVIVQLFYIIKRMKLKTIEVCNTRVDTHFYTREGNYKFKSISSFYIKAFVRRAMC